MIKGLKAKRPGFMEHANMVEWPLSVAKVKQKFSDAEIVVPGHGDWGNAELLTHFLSVLEKYNIENKINAENIQKYYFDKAGNKCDALNSVYYRNVVKDTANSSYFRVKDYYFSRQIEMEGVFSSLNQQMKDVNFQTWLFCGQNIKEGKFTKWFKNGKKQFEGLFRNNIRDGKITDFYENGNKEYEGYYKNGIKDSSWTYWGEDGKKIYDALYKLGENITAKEVQYNYLLYLPKEYQDDPNKKWPLIVYLHGGSMRGNDLEKLKWYGLPKLIDEENDFPFIIVSPQCPEAKDWATDKWFMIMMNDLSNKYRILKERIYLTGVCMGGAGVWYLCSKYPDIFAAAAPVAGFTNYLNLPAKAERIKHIPFWIFHSENDKIVPIKESEDMLNALNKCKGNTRSSFTKEGGHNVKYVTDVYRNQDLYDWFMKYKKNK
jgi:predicted esterase/antitoxin component YwqK of YwqJK toxin-antitoxin module